MRDKFELVAHVMLLRRSTGKNGGEIFLLERNGSGYLDGYYGLPGGHVQEGESTWMAAARECAEETGVVLAPQLATQGTNFVATLTYRGSVADTGCENSASSIVPEQGVNLVFAATEWRGTPIVNEPDRLSSGGFFPFAELPDTTIPWVTDLVMTLDSQSTWPSEANFKPSFKEYRWD